MGGWSSFSFLDLTRDPSRSRLIIQSIDVQRLRWSSKKAMVDTISMFTATFYYDWSCLILFEKYIFFCIHAFSSNFHACLPKKTKQQPVWFVEKKYSYWSNKFEVQKQDDKSLPAASLEITVLVRSLKSSNIDIFINFNFFPKVFKFRITCSCFFFQWKLILVNSFWKANWPGYPCKKFWHPVILLSFISQFVLVR